MTAEQVLAQVRASTGVAWELEGPFASGVLEGAWRVRAGRAVAVLRWHERGSPVPYNPDAPAVVEYLRRQGYPTPAWIAEGSTADGGAWSLQELAPGDPLAELDRRSAELFIELVEWHRRLRLPTTFGWNDYIRKHVFDAHPSHDHLREGGPTVHRLLEAALALAAPHEEVSLPSDEMVHCDLGVGNVLVQDGKVVAVVDIAAAGVGCAAYDLLAPAVTGVSWGSDPAAVDRLLRCGLERYDPGPIAIVAACLVIEKTLWYQTADPHHIEQRAQRHLHWLSRLRQLSH